MLPHVLKLDLVCCSWSPAILLSFHSFVQMNPWFLRVGPDQFLIDSYQTAHSAFGTIRAFWASNSTMKVHLISCGTFVHLAMLNPLVKCSFSFISLTMQSTLVFKAMSLLPCQSCFSVFILQTLKYGFHVYNKNNYTIVDIGLGDVEYICLDLGWICMDLT